MKHRGSLNIINKPVSYKQSCKKDPKPNWVICEIAIPPKNQLGYLRYVRGYLGYCESCQNCESQFAKVAKIANIYLKNQTEKNFAIFRKNINV